MSHRQPASPLIITYPDWVASVVDWDRRYGTMDERMELAVRLARANVTNGTGGPFGAAVFERDAGTLVSVGMNLVVHHNNSTLHAEMVALMMAEQVCGSYSLAEGGMPAHDLVTSCDPCAMCLGAVLWSGVSRLVCGAARDDAKRLGFDEGPVFPESYHYLEERGVRVERGILRHQAADVLRLYREKGGEIYNG